MTPIFTCFRMECQFVPPHIDTRRVRARFIIYEDISYILVAMRNLIRQKKFATCTVITKDNILLERVVSRAIGNTSCFPLINKCFAAVTNLSNLIRRINQAWGDRRCRLHRSTLTTVRIESDVLHMECCRRCCQSFSEHRLAFEIHLPRDRALVIQLARECVERLVYLFLIRCRICAVRHHRDERVRRRLFDVRITGRVVRYVCTVAARMTVVDLLPTRIVVNHQLACIILKNVSLIAIRT